MSPKSADTSDQPTDLSSPLPERRRERSSERVPPAPSLPRATPADVVEKILYLRRYYHSFWSASDLDVPEALPRVQP